MRRKAKRRSGRRCQTGSALYVTSAFIKEALDRGARHSSGTSERRSPSAAARRCAASVWPRAAFVGGSIGFDGLFVIKPDGKIYIQSGIGNLGTESVSDCHRVTAEILGVPWEKCEITWGHTGEEPAVELSIRRQPDHARHDARGLRGGARMPRRSCSRSPPRISAASPKITKWRTNACSARAAARA